MTNFLGNLIYNMCVPKFPVDSGIVEIMKLRGHERLKNYVPQSYIFPPTILHHLMGNGICKCPGSTGKIAHKSTNKIPL